MIHQKLCLSNENNKFKENCLKNVPRHVFLILVGGHRKIEIKLDSLFAATIQGNLQNIPQLSAAIRRWVTVGLR